MGEKAKNFGNRLGNTAMIAPRVGGTALHTATDIIDTTTALPKDALQVVSNTAHSIKDVFVNAWTKGKWYQRVGNVILSPIVATGTAVEGAVRTAVTPVVNGVVNTRNTAKNTVTNTRRSTFGRLFSKKPISDFSYDKLNTADIIKKDQNRFSKLQFGSEKKKTNSSEKSKVATAGAAAATASAATAATVEKAKEDPSKIDKLSKQVEEMQKQLKTLLEQNEALKKENDALKKNAKNESKDNKDNKTEASKDNGGKAEKKDKEGSEKKEGKTEGDKGEKTDKKSEKGDGTEKKDEGGKENKEEDKKEKKLENADRIAEIIKDGSTGKVMLDKVQNNHPNITIKFDDSSEDGHIRGDTITIGTKNKDTQLQVFLHELSHILIQDKVPGANELSNYIKGIIDSQNKTLFAISNNKVYDTNEKKSIEDTCELIALYAQDEDKFDKHMESIQKGKDGLVKITPENAKELKKLCKKVIDGLK